MFDKNRKEQNTQPNRVTEMGMLNRSKYILIGGGIGAALALLFAPKPGSELRGEIADVTRKSYDATLEKVNELSAHSSEVLRTGKEKAKEMLDLATSKIKLNFESDSAAEVVKSTANAATKALNSVEREVLQNTARASSNPSSAKAS